jgi:uncharacterized RDD family membrane protein YckC
MRPTSATSTTLPYETASWARRALALVVDWAACWLVVSVFGGWNTHHNWWVLLAYLIESVVFTATAGGSFGKVLTRLRTVRSNGDPRPLDPLRALARQIMVTVVVPPLIFRPDGRGLHDLAAGTATVTLATYRSAFRHLPA